MICIKKGVIVAIRYHLNESLAYPTYQREPKSIYGMPSMHPLGKLICTQIHNSHKVKPKAHFSHSAPQEVFLCRPFHSINAKDGVKMEKNAPTQILT